MTARRPADGTVTYEVRVDGHLDEHWASWLGGLRLTHATDGTSILRGPITDQAQLHGLLAKVRDLGATLLSVRALDTPSRPPDGSPGRMTSGAGGRGSGHQSGPAETRPH